MQWVAEYTASDYHSRLKIAEREGWRDRIKTKADYRAVEDGCYFNENRGYRPCNFIEKCLIHVRGRFAGQPFLLLEWQKECISDVFGWYKPDGSRRFRQAYIEIPKKNGKTTLAAALMLYLLVADGEIGAQVYTAATTRAQAGIGFRTAAQMVESSEALRDELRVINSTNRILFDAQHGFINAISSEAKNEEGLDANGVVVDELHVLPNRALWDCLRYAGAARKQPLLISITTAGVYDPESIGWEQHLYGTSLLDGTLDNTDFYAAIYSVADPETWMDEAEWFKANPSLGHTLDIEEFRSAFEEAVAVPSKQLNFKRYRLNIWTQQSEIYFPVQKIDETDKTLELDDFIGQMNFGGYDLAATEDMTAYVHQFFDEDEVLHQKLWAWLPEETAMAHSRNKNWELYSRWADEGWLQLTSGATTDYRHIERQILDLHDSVGVKEIGFDPFNAIDTTVRLQQELGDDVLFKVRQGAPSLSAPMKKLLEVILNGKYRTDGNPIMTWALGNVAAKEDFNENVRPIKMARASKIDPVVAGLNALNRNILWLKDAQESYYEEHDFFVVGA